MNKYIILLLTILLINSCTTDQDTPAIRIDDKDAQIVELQFTPDQELSPFYYLVQAEEMIINWGDGTLPIEYNYLGNNISSIKPIQYTYKQAGNYTIEIRTLRPLKFDFSKGIDGSSFDNRIESIKLTNCTTLKEFYCKNQIVQKIDLRECGALETANLVGSQFTIIDISKENTLNVFRIDSTAVPSLDCSYLTNVSELGIGAMEGKKQLISNIDLMKRLKQFYLIGNLESSTMNMTSNDSIQTVSIANSNLTQLDLSKLKQMRRFSISNNAQLKNITLADNIKLDSLILTQNVMLDAIALNSIFVGLPTISDAKSKVIVLDGNAGDATCDRSIATQKGWVFK